MARSPSRDVDLGMVPDGPSADGGAVDRARDVGRTPPAVGIELAVVSEHFAPNAPGESDPDAPVGGLPAGPEISHDALTGQEGSETPPSAGSEVFDVERGPAPSDRDTSAAAGAGGGDPGGSSILTVLLPDIRMPVIEVPAGVELAVPTVGTIRTPRLAVSEGWIRTPDLTVSASNGTVEVGVSESAVVTPEVDFSEVRPGASAMLDASSAGATSNEAVPAWVVTDEQAMTVQLATTLELLGSAAGGPLGNA